MMRKECLECKDAFHGRADAKFCSGACRSAYNNRRNSRASEEVRRVNAILKKNRKILAMLNRKGTQRVKREDLRRAGFDFNYLTNVYQTNRGKVYRFCYEQGYLDTEDDFLTLVVKKEYVR